VSKMAAERLKASLEYAGMGLRIVPLHVPALDGKGCSCGNPGCTSPGKHPRSLNWGDLASSDPTKIKEWFATWPELNIGVATGRESGIFVMDIDNEHSLTKFTDIYGEPSPTLTAKSGRGRHLYFRHPGIHVKNTRGFYKTSGIDIRGDGGLIVLPPSLHHTGALYEWIEPRLDIVSAPDWLEELVTAEAPSDLIPTGRLFSDNRKRAIFEIASVLYAKGNDRTFLRRAMLSFNLTKCSPVLEEPEVLGLVQCAMDYVDKSGKKDDGFKGRKVILPWRQNRVEESAVKPFRLRDYQRGWLAYIEEFAWLNGAMLAADTDALFSLVCASSPKKFDAEIATILVSAGFEEKVFEDRRYWVHPGMAEEWADAAVKWINRSATSAFNRASKKQHHSNHGLEEAA